MPAVDNGQNETPSITWALPPSHAVARARARECSAWVPAASTSHPILSTVRSGAVLLLPSPAKG
jgi:hypothetical protein